MSGFSNLSSYKGKFVKPEGDVYQKNEALTKRIIQLCNHLSGKPEEIMSKHILTSATNVGKYIYKANFSIDKMLFLSNMHKAYENCIEILYWINILEANNLDNGRALESLLADWSDLIKIIHAIVRSNISTLEGEGIELDIVKTS
ncbi:MAG: four helix bundle protein [Defluviitaleaceae bacterium]|nr:four helix bundle protein [Defluviitaleaceae bacterium]